MNKNIEYLCKVCNQTCKKIAPHVKSKHNLLPKDYYDLYIKTDDNEGICPVCNKPTVFLGITYGYRKHCSVSCSSADPNVQAKNKATNMKLYGVEHNWNIGELREHQEETMLKKYGVKHNWQSSELRSKEKLKVSQLEQYMIDKLKELNIDYKYRYYGKDQYPYEVDFYLPNDNIFIEINGTALHDNHIFDPTNENDLKQLEYLKSRTDSSWYRSKIRIWLKDKEKYDIAMKNKLNYVVLWSKLDIDNYIDGLRKSI